MHGRAQRGLLLGCLLAGCLLIGCYAEPPLPAMAFDLSGCHPGSYATRTRIVCAGDADCRLCASEDDPCGQVVSAADARNLSCSSPDVEHCGGASAACCEGRCVRSLGPPPL